MVFIGIGRLYCAKIRFLVNGFHRYWEVILCKNKVPGKWFS